MRKQIVVWLGAMILGTTILGTTPAISAAQEGTGRIVGTVSDSGAAVLDGVQVTASGPALSTAMVVRSGADGTYRLIGLPPGRYGVVFEREGFQALRHDEIRVVVGQTLTINVQLDIAGLRDELSVTAVSPVVDTSSTAAGTSFTTEMLNDIPNARDLWATIARAPGFQLTGFDVGGSRTGTQIDYLTYGVSGQNRVVIEGINATEGSDNAGAYHDFGAFEEVQLGGAGTMLEQNKPGAFLNMVMQSGGDAFRGGFYGMTQGGWTVSNNVPSEFRTANQPDEDGFFRTSPLTRGNQTTEHWEVNPQIGGPIRAGTAWFFGSYRLEDQFKSILGLPDLAETRLETRSAKVTVQLPGGNRVTGFYSTRAKLQPLRDLSPLRPVSTAVYQNNDGYLGKVEWTSIAAGRFYVTLLAGAWGSNFPQRPTTENGRFPVQDFQPGRIDLATNEYFDGGAFDSYLHRRRRKPQLTGSVIYIKDGGKGSHEIKVGFERIHDEERTLHDQPFDVFYRDRAGAPVEVDIYNTPGRLTAYTSLFGVYAQDSWKLNPHLSVNAGLRVDRYRDGWPAQQQTPNGVAVLAGDPRFVDFFAPRDVPAHVVSRSVNVMPRLGLAYDVGATGRSVVKVFFGRSFYDSNSILAVQENPIGKAQLRYEFRDQNGNHLLDGPAELGNLVQTVGGAGFVRIDPDLERPVSNELSLHVEREVASEFSIRTSYVYKNIRNEWAEVDLVRAGAYTEPITVTDPGPDGRSGTADDRRLDLLDRQAAVGSDRVFTNPDGFDSDYHTIEIVANRRLRSGWMLMGSAGYTWLTEPYGATSSTSPVSSAGTLREFNWRPNMRSFGRETTSIWNYRAGGRRDLRWGLGLAGSLRVQSGRQWGRALNVRLPNAGSETIRVEPVTANRAPAVAIADLRFDRRFVLPGRYGRLTANVDIFNLFNAGTVTAFRTLTAANFKEVTALLDPRIVRFGLTYDF